MTRNDKIRKVARAYACSELNDNHADIEDIVTAAFEDGVEYAMSHVKCFWHDAHGVYLPEIDREVIVLFQDHKDDKEHLRVGFGHRPDPQGYVVRSLGDGRIETLHPKCYGKGGWNGDNIKYWLDVDCDLKSLDNVFKEMDNDVEDFIDVCESVVKSKKNKQ